MSNHLKEHELDLDLLGWDEIEQIERALDGDKGETMPDNATEDLLGDWYRLYEEAVYLRKQLKKVR